jgi:hypothetical protein
MIRQMDATQLRWIDEAVEAGRNIGIEDSAVRRAYSVVLNAFGDEWLQRELPKCNPKKYGGLLAGHPLVHMLRMGQPPQTSAIVELSVYLNAFFDDSHASEFIQRLKDAQQFPNARFELAVAYRFKAVGCGCSFDPPTKAGAADSMIEFGRHKWIVECSRQNPSPAAAKRDAIVHAVGQAILDALQSRDVPVAVRVFVRENMPQNDVTRMAKMADRLARQVNARPWNQYEHEDCFWRVEVRQLSESEDLIPQRPDDSIAEHWDLTAESKSVLRKLVEPFPKDLRERIPGTPHVRLYARVECGQRNEEQSLLKKVRKKLSQSHGHESSPPRLIVLETYHDLWALDWSELEKGLANLLLRPLNIEHLYPAA